MHFVIIFVLGMFGCFPTLLAGDLDVPRIVSEIHAEKLLQRFSGANVTIFFIDVLDTSLDHLQSVQNVCRCIAPGSAFVEANYDVTLDEILQHQPQIVSISLGPSLAHQLKNDFDKSTGYCLSPDFLKGLAKEGILIVIAGGNDHILMGTTSYTESFSHFVKEINTDPNIKGAIILAAQTLPFSSSESLSVFGTLPGAAKNFFVVVPNKDLTLSKKPLSGSSFAAPLVSGTAALLFQASGKEAWQVAQMIWKGATPVRESPQTKKLIIHLSKELALSTNRKQKYWKKRLGLEDIYGRGKLDADGAFLFGQSTPFSYALFFKLHQNSSQLSYSTGAYAERYLSLKKLAVIGKNYGEEDKSTLIDMKVGLYHFQMAHPKASMTDLWEAVSLIHKDAREFEAAFKTLLIGMCAHSQSAMQKKILTAMGSILNDWQDSLDISIDILIYLELIKFNHAALIAQPFIELLLHHKLFLSIGHLLQMAERQSLFSPKERERIRKKVKKAQRKSTSCT